MASEPKIIDIDNVPELLRIAAEVRDTREPRVLRQQGENVAMLIPIKAVEDYGPGRTKTEEDYQTFLASAGGWKGIVDADQFVKDNYESRRLSSRPPVKL